MLQYALQILEQFSQWGSCCRITLRENLCVNSTWTWSSCDAYPSSNVNIQLPQMFQFKNSEALSRTLRSAGAPRPGHILLYPNFTPPKITTLTFPGDTNSRWHHLSFSLRIWKWFCYDSKMLKFLWIWCCYTCGIFSCTERR